MSQISEMEYTCPPERGRPSGRSFWLTSVYERGKEKRSGEECGAPVDVRSFPGASSQIERSLKMVIVRFLILNDRPFGPVSMVRPRFLDGDERLEEVLNEENLIEVEVKTEQWDARPEV
ncbi:hypothetical protein LR48_Vigan05g074600 [Vigna angularis]|uniref:Uncharacterized protein n=1 Tax=Phaseolus angularis TaxID=3914 RepID=A0A0L9UKP6_PHAAN|nr:hypothetical protein LR48_Vigan05g074600 [Vigna angularis]